MLSLLKPCFPHHDSREHTLFSSPRPWPERNPHADTLLYDYIILTYTHIKCYDSLELSERVICLQPLQADGPLLQPMKGVIPDA